MLKRRSCRLCALLRVGPMSLRRCLGRLHPTPGYEERHHTTTASTTSAVRMTGRRGIGSPPRANGRLRACRRETAASRKSRVSNPLNGDSSEVDSATNLSTSGLVALGSGPPSGDSRPDSFASLAGVTLSCFAGTRSALLPPFSLEQLERRLSRFLSGRRLCRRRRGFLRALLFVPHT
jgi:hypothetical protein